MSATINDLLCHKFHNEYKSVGGNVSVLQVLQRRGGRFLVCMFLIYKTDVHKNGFIKCFRALVYVSYVSLRVVDHYQ